MTAVTKESLWEMVHPAAHRLALKTDEEKQYTGKTVRARTPPALPTPYTTQKIRPGSSLYVRIITKQGPTGGRSILDIRLPRQRFHPVVRSMSATHFRADFNE